MLPAFLASYLVALAATPVAIRVARRIDLFDHPTGYKEHARPTPYLGGAAVLAGFLAGALLDGATWDSELAPIFAGGLLIWVVGTLDDRLHLGPRIRVFAEALVGLLLWQGGLGWSLFPGEVADLAVTVLWVVGIINAFNLMDNVDGAAGTVAAVSAGGIALLTVHEGPGALTALAVAISGACIGFLHFNLTRPARIFLGDGGSMLLGFLLAALAMGVWRLDGMIGPAFLPAIMLVGLPVLDMTMVIVSRLRRGAPVGKGSRDHITHRLLPKLGSTWAVALTLAIAQAALSLYAIQLMGEPRGTIFTGVAVAFMLGVVTIIILETPLFHPDHGHGTARMRNASNPPPGRPGRPDQPPRPRPSESWEILRTSQRRE
jgi:UDP-GlcNAc:undecaprenyl-phosphate/decaprenyl-phosphate GlcNAc-1-phosphate transferase